MADDPPDTYSTSGVKNRTHTVFKKELRPAQGDVTCEIKSFSIRVSGYRKEI